MRRILIILICCVLFSCEEKDNFFFNEILFTDHNERLLNYYAVSDNDKQLLFGEEFDNNDSGWLKEIREYLDTIAGVKIENGNLVLDLFPSNKWYYNHHYMPIEIPHKQMNFEVEMKLIVNDHDYYNRYKYKYGTTFCIAALHDNDSIRYVFQYKGNGNYLGIELSRVVDDNWNSVFKCVDNENLKLDQFNTLTIRKIANKYAIFFNYKLFYIFKDNDFNYYPSIMFQYGRVNVYDYFRVYHLP